MMNKLHFCAPFMKITAVSRLTGISGHWLRKGCVSGEIPHICAGRTYLVNVPALLDQLGVEYSMEASKQ